MKYYISILITIILFSTIEVVSKLALKSLSPQLLAMIRFFVAGLIFSAISYKKILLIRKKDFFKIILISIIGVTGAFTIFHHSLIYLEASTAAVIFSINPIFCTLIATFFLREKLHGKTVIGLLIGFTGVYIVSFGFSIPEISSIKGPLLITTASLLFSIYIVWSKKYVKKYGPMTITGITFLIGSLVMTPLIKNWSIDFSGHALYYVSYLTIFATGLAYLLYFYGLKHLPISVGTSIFYLKPIFATLLAIIVLSEKPNGIFYFGLIIILLSLVLTTHKPNR